MIGLVKANPSVLMVTMKYAKFRPKLIFTGGSKDLAELARVFYDMAQTKDERKLVLFFEGGYDAFKKVRDVKSVSIKVPDAADPTGKAEVEIDQPIDLQQAVIVIVGLPTVLASVPGLTIVDAKEKKSVVGVQTLTTWEPIKVDFDEILENAELGFSVKKRDPLELSELFDPQLQKIPDETQRRKAATWLASRVEGLLEDDRWEKAVTKMKTFGVETEIVVGAFRLLKSKGRLDALQKAARHAATADPTTAAKEHKVPVSDLRWLDTHWPLENLK